LQLDDIIASLEMEQGLAVLEFFVKTFSTAPIVHTLNLNDNAIRIRGMEILTPLFMTLPALHSLHLENCGMSAEVAKQLCHLLSPVAARFMTLSLGHNQMGVAGAKANGTLVQDCLQLQHFDYAGSRPLCLGTQWLCHGLNVMAQKQPDGMTKLITLDLNDCHLGSGEENNKEDEGEDPIIDLAWVLQRLPHLHTLIVRDGEMEVPGLQRLLTHVQVPHLEEHSSKSELLDIIYLTLQ
jgi:hypothetical protein